MARQEIASDAFPHTDNGDTEQPNNGSVTVADRSLDTMAIANATGVYDPYETVVVGDWLVLKMSLGCLA